MLTTYNYCHTALTECHKIVWKSIRLAFSKQFCLPWAPPNLLDMPKGVLLHHVTIHTRRRNHPLFFMFHQFQFHHLPFDALDLLTLPTIFGSNLIRKRNISCFLNYLITLFPLYTPWFLCICLTIPSVCVASACTPSLLLRQLIFLALESTMHCCMPECHWHFLPQTAPFFLAVI